MPKTAVPNTAVPDDRPQLYLITPPAFDLATFPDRLATVLDGAAIACLRLSMAGQDADAIARAADALRVVAHARDVAIVIDTHLPLVARHGLDGIHLPDGAKQVRYMRRELGADAIIGAFGGATRHEGLNAAEAGADYVSFGPVGDTGLGGTRTEADLFSWWSEIIEVPVVAEGALTPELVRELTPVVDFLAIGAEIWGQDDPLAALRRLTAAMD